MSEPTAPASRLNGQLVPSEPAAGQPSPMRVFDPSQHGSYTNIPTDTMQAKITRFRCTGPADLDVEKLAGQPFNLRYFYAHAVEICDAETGELTPSIRVVLVNPEGQTFATVSLSAARSLRNLIDTFGPGPYEPPMAVRVRREKAKKAGHFHVFDLVNLVPEGGKKGGGK